MQEQQYSKFDYASDKSAAASFKWKGEIFLLNREKYTYIQIYTDIC